MSTFIFTFCNTKLTAEIKQIVDFCFSIPTLNSFQFKFLFIDEIILCSAVHSTPEKSHRKGEVISTNKKLDNLVIKNR
jgi:hypothetical protein